MVNRSCRIAFKKQCQQQKRIDRERRESIKKGYGGEVSAEKEGVEDE